MLRALVGIRLKPIAGKIKPRGWVARRQSLHPLAVDGARMSWFGVAYLPSKSRNTGHCPTVAFLWEFVWKWNVPDWRIRRRSSIRAFYGTPRLTVCAIGVVHNVTWDLSVFGAAARPPCDATLFESASTSVV